jgi:MFS family permease
VLAVARIGGVLLSALRQVLANRSIRRAETAWLIGIAGQWVYLVAVLVYAYDVGGVVATGLASTLRMLPAAVFAPLVTTIADRVPPGRVLVGVHAGRAAIIGGAAWVIASDGAVSVVLTLVMLEGIVATLHRPTTFALLPALARSPQELVASNAVTSTGEAIGTLLGPAIGGLLLALGGPVPAIGGTAAAFAVAAVAVAAIDAHRPMATATAGSGPAALRELVAGFAAIGSSRSVGILVSLFSVQTFVRGVLTVLLVAVSVELLGMGESGVGYLNSAIGAGGLLGAFVTFTLVARRHLALPLSLALGMWGLPIAIIGIVPVPVVAIAVLGVLGVANATLDVSGFSLLQRCVPNAVRGRVFGTFEGIVTLTFGLGSLVAPLVVELLGLRGALIATGLVLPTIAVASFALVRRADNAAVVPHRQLDLLRGVPMFAPLPMTALEQIAGGLVSERYAADASVIRQGDTGDCWYLIAAGGVEVVHDGRHVADLGVGDGFGEIALLSQRPRTASVIARRETELFRLPRPVFLEAVTGNAHAVLAGETLMATRLAELEEAHDGDAHESAAASELRSG